ncbi:MAG: signal peptidase II [Nannocystaceae bacterium]|nr:signal peptidase II [Nannocystaceae bacterium]
MSAFPSRARRVALAAALCVAVLALDLSSKVWVWEHLRHQRPRVVVDGWLTFEFAFNTGSAFGLADRLSSARLVFIAVTLGVLLYLTRMLRRLPTSAPLSFAAIGLFAGGALGNLHDRFVRHMWFFDRGDQYGVVDFIVLSWGARSWPAFNLADVALAAGVGLLLLGLRGRLRAESS